MRKITVEWGTTFGFRYGCVQVESLETANNRSALRLAGNLLATAITSFTRLSKKPP